MNYFIVRLRVADCDHEHSELAIYLKFTKWFKDTLKEKAQEKVYYWEQYPRNENPTKHKYN